MTDSGKVPQHINLVILLLAPMLSLCDAGYPVSAQALSDAEIRAAYCLGEMDNFVKSTKAWGASNNIERDLEEVSKEIKRFQEVGQHRQLTYLENQAYEIAKSRLDLYNQSRSMQRQIQTDGQRLRLYLMAKGLFSPGRAVDLPPLLGSIKRGETDAQLCQTETISSTQNCIWKCVMANRNNDAARSACAQGCMSSSCERIVSRCKDLSWLPF